jgi:hypothetical protein
MTKEYAQEKERKSERKRETERETRRQDEGSGGSDTALRVTVAHVTTDLCDDAPTTVPNSTACLF